MEHFRKVVGPGQTRGGNKCLGHNSAIQYIPVGPVCSCVARQRTAFNLLVARLNAPWEALHNSWRKRKREENAHDESTVAIIHVSSLMKFQLNVNGWRQKWKRKTEKNKTRGGRVQTRTEIWVYINKLEFVDVFMCVHTAETWFKAKSKPGRAESPLWFYINRCPFGYWQFYFFLVSLIKLLTIIGQIAVCLEKTQEENNSSPWRIQ